MKVVFTWYKLSLLFFGSTIVINASDNSVRFWSSINNYISSYQKYYIKKQFPVEKPTHDITVQLDISLSAQEQLFLQNRSQIVRENLKNYFDIDQPISIGFCCSGGGNRAMIGSLGLLSGAAKTNLLDITMYLAGVSGSTWTILPYFCQSAYLQKDNKQALSDLYGYYLRTLSKGIRFCFHDYCTPALLKLDQFDDFLKNLTVAYGYNQDITLVDIFGAFIGNQCLGFLGDQKLYFTWSMLADQALSGRMPLPLCTVAFKDNFSRYAYLEMSPFQSGNKTLGYIPTQYLGSPFSNKKLDVDGICPEYSLSYYLGLYGSAFAQVVQDIHSMQQSKDKTLDPILSLFEQSDNYVTTKTWNLFNNFSVTYNIQNKIKTLFLKSDLELYANFFNYNPKALSNEKILELFDAGIGCNFPISVFTDRPERAVDIIIMYDSHPGSADVKKAYDYALDCGFYMDAQMENISIEELSNSSMVVFNDPRSDFYDSLGSTILYFPTQNIDISTPPYSTFNFKYEINEIENLKNMMENALISNIETIRNIIKLIAYKKCKGE